MQGIIFGISEVKYKRDGRYRYIAFAEREGQQYLIRMTLRDFETSIRDKDGEQTLPKNGDIVQIEHAYEGKFTLDDGKKMLFNPKIFTVLDHIQKSSTEKYYLENINFFDWGVIMKNHHSKCVVSKRTWDELINLETSSLLWKLKKKLKQESLKEAYVEITTIFNVYYGWRLEREWLYHTYKNGNGSEWTLTSENLQPMRKVVLEAGEVRRTRLMLEELKLKLQDQLFLTWDDILALARKFTIPEKEVEQYARNMVWKKNYDEDFTDHLKKKATKVLYGHSGLFFIMPGGLTILEDPEPNKATYIFIGDPDFIATKLEAIRQQNINEGHNPQAWRETLYRLKKATPEDLNWFVGRIVHHDKDQWFRDLDATLEEIK